MLVSRSSCKSSVSQKAITRYTKRRRGVIVRVKDGVHDRPEQVPRRVTSHQKVKVTSCKWMANSNISNQHRHWARTPGRPSRWLQLSEPILNFPDEKTGRKIVGERCGTNQMARKIIRDGVCGEQTRDPRLAYRLPTRPFS